VPSTRYYTAIILIIVLCSFISQSESKRLVIKATYSSFTADNLGNIYTIYEDELLKFLPSGKSFARYSNLKLGAITTVDVTNPLKILVYYRDFQQIVFLDNQLSVNSDPVSLEKLGYEQTELVCAGSNNSFWIYNKQNNELIRFNESSKKIASTGNLKQVMQADIAPTFMLEHNNYLYLNSPETGIYVFDIFGAFSKIIALRELKDFQVNDNLVYYRKDSNFCSYDHRLFEEGCKKLAGSGITAAKFYNKKLLAGYKDSLVISEQ
jgi:hypothetical protein